MNPRVAALLVFGAALLFAPVLAPPFWVTLLNYIGLYSIVALGLVLLTGVAGQTSFGQAAFVGLGAYTTAYLSLNHPALSPWFNLLIGVALTSVIALFLGFITLRMKGHYLPLATIAWGISLYYIFGNLEFLGGHTGLAGIPALSFFGMPLLLFDLGDRTGGAMGDAQSPRLAARAGGACAQGRSRDGRSLRRRCRQAQDCGLRLCGLAGVRLRMALRALAAVREPDAVWPYPGNRVPVHGRGRRRGKRLGRSRRRNRDHGAQAGVAGLVAAHPGP